MNMRETLLTYALEQYGSEPQYLFERYPTFAVLRHGNKGKWYALFMRIDRSKLGLEDKPRARGEDKIEDEGRGEDTVEAGDGGKAGAEGEDNSRNEGDIEIVNVKYHSDDIPVICKQPGIYPGYHMSKKHWVSLALDGSIPLQTVKELIATSYSLTN